MRIGTSIMKGIMRALGSLPLGFHYAWAGVVSWFMKNVMRYRRDVVMVNLSRSFPDKKYKELGKISDDFYKYFGRMIAESIWLGGCGHSDRLLRQGIISYSNPEVFEKAYSESKGVMILTSHFGNWELLGGAFGFDCAPGVTPPEGLLPDNLLFVYKPLKSKMWDEIIGENRCVTLLSRGFKGYISTKSILRHVLENHKDRKLAVLMLSDQCPYADSVSDLTVEFLHQRTTTMFGGASIAHKLGWNVMYAGFCPTGKGHYELRFTQICPDASAVPIQEIMSEYYKLLQKDIESTPWSYLWSHKRWKR